MGATVTLRCERRKSEPGPPDRALAIGDWHPAAARRPEGPITAEFRRAPQPSQPEGMRPADI